MNVKNALLALFVALTIVFASTTYYESTSRTTTRTSTFIQATTVTTSACSVAMTCASFVTSPKSDVQIDSVDANTTSYGTVVFWVTFENLGHNPINFVNYALNYSVPANTTVLKQVNCPQCPAGGIGATSSYWLQHGQAWTLDAQFPSDKDFYYRLVQPGIVDVNINFTWTEAVAKPCAVAPCPSQVLPTNTTVILARFDFQTP